MFLAEEILGRTTWHMAAEKGQIQVLNKMSDWANDVLTHEESSNIFLSKGVYIFNVLLAIRETTRYIIPYKLMSCFYLTRWSLCVSTDPTSAYGIKDPAPLQSSCLMGME
jgi:hypothetical protein